MCGALPESHMSLNFEALHDCLDDMPLAFTVIELVFDESGQPVDWIFRYLNAELQRIVQVPPEHLLNRYFYRDVFSQINSKRWLDFYYRAAILGEKLEIHEYSPEIAKYLYMKCFPWKKRGFCALVISEETRERQLQYRLDHLVHLAHYDATTNVQNRNSYESFCAHFAERYGSASLQIFPESDYCELWDLSAMQEPSNSLKTFSGINALKPISATVAAAQVEPVVGAAAAPDAASPDVAFTDAAAPDAASSDAASPEDASPDAASVGVSERASAQTGTHISASVRAAAKSGVSGAGREAGAGSGVGAGKGAGATVGVFFVDVNELKRINDTFGHESGTFLIRMVSDKIKEQLSGYNFQLFRVGGDEFVVILPGISLELLAQLEQRLKESLVNTEVPHFPLVLAAVGSAWHQSAQDLKDVVSQADAKMYEHKRALKAQGKPKSAPPRKVKP